MTELQRQAAERDFLFDDEASLRKQISEEECAALESHRLEEKDSRHLVEEVLRKAHYEAKEVELAAKLKEKSEALEETQAAMSQLKQASELLESEKTSALRRVALLSNELELAQVSVVESERRVTSAEQEHQVALKALEAEFDALQQRHHELEATYADLEAQVSKASESKATHVDRDGSGAEEEASVAPATDAETAALLRVMQTEVERYKATATQLQEEVTRARSEEEKSNLLVGILNTQLESVREDNKRLHGLSEKNQSEVEAAGQLRREAQEARQSALSEMDQALSTAAVQQRQLQLELDVHRKEAEKLSKELSLLREEHGALRAELTQVSQNASQQAQSDLATNMAMQVELANQKKDLQLALRAKEAAEDEKFNHKILTRAELDSLKSRLQRLQETMERKDREAFETIAVLRADVAKQTAKSEQQSKDLDSEVQGLHKQLLSTLTESERLFVELNTLQKRSKEREHELYEQLTSVTAHHAAATEELERLRTSAAQRDAEYTHNFICLTAERENLKTKVNELTEAAAQSRRTHTESLERMRVQMEELKGQLTTEAGTLQAAQAKERARADIAERNARRLQDHVRDLEYQAHRGTESHGEAVKTLQAESRDLRSELSIAKRTIERLECALGDQASYRQLTELNDRLTRELEKAQQAGAALNGKVALLQTEADTMGGYTVRKAQEEKEQLSRRLRQVERRYRLMAPLFAQLRSFAEARQSSALNPELYDALEAFDQESAFVSPQTSRNGVAERASDSVGMGTATANVAAAPPATVNCAATMPAAMQPRPPSVTSLGVKPRVTPRKQHPMQSSIIVTGTSTPTGTQDRLPLIA